MPWTKGPCRRGLVKGDSQFPSLRNWMVGVPSTETAKIRKGRFGDGMRSACFFRLGFEILLMGTSFLGMQCVQSHRDLHLV